jgi:hypothetical protein
LFIEWISRSGGFIDPHQMARRHFPVSTRRRDVANRANGALELVGSEVALDAAT